MSIADIFKKVVSRASVGAEKLATGSESALRGLLVDGVGGTLGSAAKSLWSGPQVWGMRAATATAPLVPTKIGSIPGIVRELFPNFRRGTLGALPKFGAASFIDRYLESTDASEMSGAGQFGLRALSFGLRFGAYRSLARGAVGTALGTASRVSGDSMHFYDTYNAAAKGLGPFWKQGSITNYAFKGMALGARAIGYTPIRAVVGAAGTVKAGVGLAGRLGGDLPLVGRPLSWMADKVGASSISTALHPKVKFGRSFMRSAGIINKEFDAPIVSTLMLGSAAAGGLYHRNEQRKHGGKGWASSSAAYNPMNYGAGMHAMRRGSAQNFGPALTLMLHSNHRRVMP